MIYCKKLEIVHYYSRELCGEIRRDWRVWRHQDQLQDFEARPRQEGRELYKVQHFEETRDEDCEQQPVQLPVHQDQLQPRRGPGEHVRGLRGRRPLRRGQGGGAGHAGLRQGVSYLSIFPR